MPKKKSVKLCARTFRKRTAEIAAFLTATAAPGVSKEHLSWLHDFALIRLYREFETLVQGALVGAINNDTATLSSRSGISFPKHLTDEVYEYLLIGDGYFDFRGRDGLIRMLKRFVPADHYLVKVLRDERYKDALERLGALRNFAAHSSSRAKTKAKEAIGVQRLHSAGAWLKRGKRFELLVAHREAQGPGHRNGVQGALLRAALT